MSAPGPVPPDRSLTCALSERKKRQLRASVCKGAIKTRPTGSLRTWYKVNLFEPKTHSIPGHATGDTLMNKHFRSLMISMVVLAVPSGASAQSCAAGPLTVQILGSGGPAINRERASASYLLWAGGQAKMLVDMGGGAYVRFGQSQAKTSDLALVAISHPHPDHVSDLPAFLWLSHQVRNEPMPIVGPSGNSVAGPAANDIAPDFPTFLARLFDEKNGAFQVLGDGDVRALLPRADRPGCPGTRNRIQTIALLRVHR